jgi:outer membrane lipoprotein-sorting protein
MRARKYKRRWAALVAALALSLSMLNAAGAAQGNDDLSAVIAAMNRKADSFKNVAADFEWETYTSVVKEKDLQKGRSYFRREGHDLAAKLDVTEPNPKQLLYKDGVVSFYEPKINRVTKREVGKNKADVDAAMSLGFGGTGDDLLRSYDVKFEAWEVLDGVHTAKLELVSKNPQKAFSKAVIWIDPERDIAVQQQFFNQEDYRLIRYRNIKLNGRLDDVFKLRTKGTPEIVTQ